MDVPEFRSEAEEHSWWDRNSERVAELVLRHGVKGKLVKIREKTQNISLRIPVTDVDQAKRLAARHKEPYQAVLKRALRNGLKQEQSAARQ